MIVEKTLEKMRKSSFEWGVSDCILIAADYLVDCGYDDYANDFRNTYNTEKQADIIIDQFGGEFELINSTGLKYSDIHSRGDVVLVKFERLTCGISTGDSIAFLTETRGMIEVKCNFLKIEHCWKVEPKCQV